MGIREQNKIRTRKKILSVSNKLFHKKGFEAVGIREIADKCGISVGTYYNYFSTKEDIIFAMIDEIIPTLFEDWETKTSKKKTKDATSLLVEIFRVHFSVFSERIFIVKEFFNIITNPHFATKHSEYGKKISEYKSIFWEFITKRIEVFGIIPDPSESKELRSFFWAIYNTSIYHWIQDDSENKAKTYRYLEVTINTFLYGLSRDK